MKLEVGCLKRKVPNWKWWADRLIDRNNVVFFTCFFSWDSYCQVTLNFKYFTPFVPGFWKAHLTWTKNCCRILSTAAVYQYPSPFLVESSPDAHHSTTPDTAPEFWALLPDPPHLVQFILTSLALFCWLSLHSGSQRYTCKEQEDFHLYSYPHMSTDLCLCVKKLSIWVTACFSVEDFVIVLPGRRQFQKLLRLYTTSTTVSCPVSPLQKRQLCAQLCGHRGQSLPKSRESWFQESQTQDTNLKRDLVTRTRKKAVDSIDWELHILPCWQGSKSTTGL